MIYTETKFKTCIIIYRYIYNSTLKLNKMHSRNCKTIEDYSNLYIIIIRVKKSEFECKYVNNM